MREQILKKALEQFLLFGTREMSNVRLAEVLGVSTKTIYKYFKNKEDLLEQALHRYHDQQYQALENMPVEQAGACTFFDMWYYALEIEYKVNHKFFEDLHYYYPDLARKVENTIDKKFREKFHFAIQNGISDGTFRKEIVPEVVLEAVFSLNAAIVRTGRFKKFQLSSYSIFSNTIVIYIRGLCSEEGVRQLNEHIAAIESVNPIRSK